PPPKVMVSWAVEFVVPLELNFDSTWEVDQSIVE
ncbi:hypothetical protein A2U01_0079103, partial [Trifolium medium]|nr:hypothetical protein [Trifolium medium]